VNFWHSLSGGKLLPRKGPRSGNSLADQVRMWKDNVRERMRLEHERSLGSSRIKDGGGAAQGLEHLRMELMGMDDQGRGSWQLVESRSSSGVEGQQAFNPENDEDSREDSME
jgi:hypothetical protein